MKGGAKRRGIKGGREEDLVSFRRASSSAQGPRPGGREKVVVMMMVIETTRMMKETMNTMPMMIGSMIMIETMIVTSRR